MPPAIVRLAARVLLLDDRDRILLFQGRGLGDNPDLWLPPGGGLEPGETHEQAALREVEEETGLRLASLGPCLWHRSHVFTWDRQLIEARERYYLCRVPSFTIALGHVNADAAERDFLVGHRWWSLDEIEASSDVFVPRALAILLRPVLKGQIAEPPLVVGE